MRIVLVVTARIQQPGPRRQHRRHIDHELAARDQLLRQQRANASRAFNRPQPRFELCRPTQQPVALATIGNHRQLAHELFVGMETVKSHLSRLYAKLEARDRHDAVARALAFGLLG